MQTHLTLFVTLALLIGSDANATMTHRSVAKPNTVASKHRAVAVASKARRTASGSTTSGPPTTGTATKTTKHTGTTPDLTAH